MLVITRKKEESILIGDDVCIKIISIENGSVKIGIDAPKGKHIYRHEIYDKIKEENKNAMKTSSDRLKIFR